MAWDKVWDLPIGEHWTAGLSRAIGRIMLVGTLVVAWIYLALASKAERWTVYDTLDAAVAVVSCFVAGVLLCGVATAIDCAVYTARSAHAREAAAHEEPAENMEAAS